MRVIFVFFFVFIQIVRFYSKLTESAGNLAQEAIFWFSLSRKRLGVKSAKYPKAASQFRTGPPLFFKIQV